VLTTLHNGTEWAATGEVLQEVPTEYSDFRGTIFGQIMPHSLDELVSEIKNTN
jgi:hypothetical protein